ncbi:MULTISPECIES: hypothetical protein [Streptomyces]|uniref:hypothetical protein n=1 Tax=Streptomyces TaxID=1883 RepID=UPI0011B09FF7|nr:MULTISPECIES: hypothetical protein [Streptomyces]WJK68078.1 hypothetical protein QIA47_16915 [Streptomyces albidoflavus]
MKTARSQVTADRLIHQDRVTSSKGLEALLRDHWIEICVLFIGGLVALAARKKDMASAATMTGIVLLGVAVVGIAGNAGQIGDALAGLVISD